MVAHAAVRCNIIISGTCQSHDKAVSEKYLGKTVPGNGCWSDEPHCSGGLGMTSQGIFTFALCKVVFPMNTVPLLIWVHIYTCTHKPLHNSGLKGPLEAQTPTQSSTHLDPPTERPPPGTCLHCFHQRESREAAVAMHYKEEHKALYVLIVIVS